MSTIEAPNAVERAGPAAMEATLTVADGTELFYRAWIPAARTGKAVVLVHRGHEHSGRWQQTVEGLGLGDVTVFACDTRGHGRSAGERGAGPDFATLVRDLDQFVRHICDRYGMAVEDLVVLGHSVGAVTVAAWVHDYGPPIRGMILATPALRVRLYVPFAIGLLRLRQRLLGPGFVKSYVKASMLTHDAEQARVYGADPLIFRQIAVNILLDLHDAGSRLIADAGAITAPTLLLSAGSDWVVSNSAQRRFFDRLSAPEKQIEVLPGFYHAIFHERERCLAVDRVRSFIRQCFGRPPTTPPLLEADQRGYTRTEYDRLRLPGGLRFAPLRWVLKTIGRLSTGLRLGWRTGFDSGLTLDYIYENRPRGVTPLGWLIDRNYLNSIGWRGIRLRRAHLERRLREIIEQTHAAGRPVRILDIASGAGRYVLETMRALPHIPVSAVLRDYKPESVAAARRLADELGLPNVTALAGDAFDRDSFASIVPRPTIAIVSGLYELFPENEPVFRSLRGLADALEPGGHLLYTNQPWHPQLEFIARVLTNREGRPWIMRRRTQAEMDQLVRAAGFEKLSQEIDPWGIFTVSTARRAGV